MIFIVTILLIFVAKSFGGEITPSQPRNPVKDNTEIILTVSIPSVRKVSFDLLQSVSVI